MSEQEPADQQPVLRVVRGNPDDAEIAALTAALASVSAASASQQTPERKPMSLWADRSARLRPAAGGLPLPPGPNSWRASALPR
jgi:hypothetical protein